MVQREAAGRALAQVSSTNLLSMISMPFMSFKYLSLFCILVMITAVAEVSN